MALALGTCWSRRQLWSRIIWAPASLEAEEALELLPDLRSPACPQHGPRAQHTGRGWGGGVFLKGEGASVRACPERARVCARTEQTLGNQCARGLA